MSDKKKEKDKDTEPAFGLSVWMSLWIRGHGDGDKSKKGATLSPRLRMLLEGLATAGGSAGGGVLLLALIGWMFPAHQESQALQPVLWVVSLAMILGTVWGVWLIIKAILGWK